MKSNVYYSELLDMRVKIVTVLSSGKCVVFCKDQKYRKAKIENLKRVY
jgi:translation initiation factor IF-1